MKILKSAVLIICVIGITAFRGKAQSSLQITNSTAVNMTELSRILYTDSLRQPAVKVYAAANVFVKKPNYTIEAPVALPNGYDRRRDIAVPIPTLKVNTEKR